MIHLELPHVNVLSKIDKIKNIEKFEIWSKIQMEEILEPDFENPKFEVYIFLHTRFECSCTSSPLVSSVVSHLLHSFRVYFFVQILFRHDPKQFSFLKALTSVLSDYGISKLHPLGVENVKMMINILTRCDQAVGKYLHSKRVEKM
jgi:hypothetical protein